MDLTTIVDRYLAINNTKSAFRDTIVTGITDGTIDKTIISQLPLDCLDVTKLPGVPTANIMTPSPAYKPFRYDFGYSTWKLQKELFWLPETIKMGDDISDWDRKLTDNERNLMTNIFPLFVQNDILVNNVYIQHYAPRFPPNEIQMAISAIADMESIHTAAYAYLLDSLSFPENTYSVFLENKEMSEKYNYTAGFKMNSLMGTALAMFLFGGLTEGVQLFATFAIMMNFPRRNLLKGMGQVVSWSCRDESLHVMFVAKLFKHYMEEFGHLIDWDVLTKAAHQATRKVVEFEHNFTDMAFSMGPVEGMTVESHKRYIESIADDRLRQFGFPTIYGDQETPYPWLDLMLGGLELANFFEQRSTDYSKFATSGTWDDAWAPFDNV